jgi:hypothetical protein
MVDWYLHSNGSFMMKRPTLKAKIEASKLIEKYCHREGNFCKYDDDWDDDKVTQIVNDQGEYINKESVKMIRIELLGKLRTSPVTVKQTMLELVQKVEKLEKRVTELENDLDQVESLITRPNLDNKPLPIPNVSSPKFGIPKT